MGELRRPKVWGMSPELAVGVGLLLAAVSIGLIAFAALVAPILGTGKFGILLFAGAVTGIGILMAGIVQWVRETALNRRGEEAPDASADQ